MASILKVGEIKSKTGNDSISIADNGNATTNGTLTATGAITASGGIANAGTISAGTIGGNVVFPSGHLVQVVNTSYSFTADSDGIHGGEIHQAFGAVQNMTLKYANTKIWCMVMVPEIYSNGKRFGLGFCYTTNSGLTAGQGNNNPEGNHSATVVQLYRQRDQNGSATISFIATISNSIDTTYYFAPVISQLSADGTNIYANWGGQYSTMTQSFGEIAP